jgi:hypothetical protein
MVPGEVMLTTYAGRVLRARVTTMPGSAAAPLTPAEIQAKLRFGFTYGPTALTQAATETLIGRING